nr:sugar ABC transporter permease [uncultured Sphaerochaeta sp.]
MKQISSMKRKEGIAGVLFIAPTIVYFLVFFALPLVVCVYASFTNWNILSPNRSFVGWRNYAKLLSDPKFWTALSNTFYMLIPIPLYLFFGLLFAYACHKKIPWERLFRVIYYLPYISSIVALVIIWKWLFNSEFGLVSHMLSIFGIKPIDWLNDPVWTKRMIVLMITWKFIGIISIYYLAVLKSISKTYYEAAEIDGASKTQQFLRITFPLITPTTFYLAVVGLIGSLQTFIEIQLFAPDGGRGYGVATIVYYIWQKAFQSSQMGYASATATLFGIFILLLTVVQLSVAKWWVYEGD